MKERGGWEHPKIYEEKIQLFYLRYSVVIRLENLLLNCKAVPDIMLVQHRLLAFPNMDIEQQQQ